MSPTGAELLRQVRSKIDEVDPAAVHAQLGNGAVVVDVREPEEFGVGHRVRSTCRGPIWSRASRPSCPIAAST
jgi:hypothetical protein